MGALDLSVSATLNVAHAVPPAPAPWVSWRVYRPHNGGCRALLLNLRTREFLLLEDAAAAYWELLCQRPANWSEMAGRLELAEADVVAFAQELTDANLLSAPDSAATATVADSTDLDVEVAQDLETEMMAWAAAHGFVYAAHWEVTYRCNELCVHCYNPGAAHTPDEKPQRDTDELSTEEAKQMLHQLVDLGVFRLTFSGGEATLRRDFLELLAYARQLGFQVVIYTNGLKLPPEVLESMAALYPSAVEVSVYSADAAQHDAVTRVPGSFEKTMQSLAFFRERGIPTVFKSSLTKGTVGGWQHTQELGERSASSVILNTMISQGVDGKQAPLNTAAEFGQLVVLAATPGSPLYVGGAEHNWGRDNTPARSQKPCGAGHGSIAITPEGHIYPCISFPMVIGEVRGGDLLKLKRLPPAPATDTVPDFVAADPAELLDQWRRVRMNSMTECGTHERCHYCGDLCPGDAFVQNGNPLSAAENHCRQAYARMAAGQHLQAGHTLDSLRQKFGISAEFGREFAKTRPTIKLHPVQ